LFFFYILLEVFTGNNRFFKRNNRFFVVLNDYFSRNEDYRKLYAFHRGRNFYSFYKFNFFHKSEKLPLLHVWRDNIELSKFNENLKGVKLTKNFVNNNQVLLDLIFSKNALMIGSSRYFRRLDVIRNLSNAILHVVPSAFVFFKFVFRK